MVLLKMFLNEVYFDLLFALSSNFKRLGGHHYAWCEIRAASQTSIYRGLPYVGQSLERIYGSTQHLCQSEVNILTLRMFSSATTLNLYI